VVAVERPSSRHMYIRHRLELAMAFSTPSVRGFVVTRMPSVGWSDVSDGGVGGAVAGLEPLLDSDDDDDDDGDRPLPTRIRCAANASCSGRDEGKPMSVPSNSRIRAGLGLRWAASRLAWSRTL